MCGQCAKYSQKTPLAFPTPWQVLLCQGEAPKTLKVDGVAYDCQVGDLLVALHASDVV